MNTVNQTTVLINNNNNSNNNNNNKAKFINNQKIAQELSELVVYTQAVKLRGTYFNTPRKFSP
jgi:hypothetical protein